MAHSESAGPVEPPGTHLLVSLEQTYLEFGRNPWSWHRFPNLQSKEFSGEWQVETSATVPPPNQDSEEKADIVPRGEG